MGEVNFLNQCASDVGDHDSGPEAYVLVPTCFVFTFFLKFFLLGSHQRSCNQLPNANDCLLKIVWHRIKRRVVEGHSKSAADCKTEQGVRCLQPMQSRKDKMFGLSTVQAMLHFQYRSVLSPRLAIKASHPNPGR
jgi:hypothetical protein